jgi:hypothetical protein
MDVKNQYAERDDGGKAVVGTVGPMEKDKLAIHYAKSYSYKPTTVEP